MKTKIGGQAVIEGVMMRGESSMALSVRDESGQIRVETKRLSAKKTVVQKGTFFAWRRQSGNFHGGRVQNNRQIRRSNGGGGSGHIRR